MSDTTVAGGPVTRLTLGPLPIPLHPNHATALDAFLRQSVAHDITVVITKDDGQVTAVALVPAAALGARGGAPPGGWLVLE